MAFKCKNCGKEITGKNSGDPRRKFCSRQCCNVYTNKKIQKLNSRNTNIPTSTVGAISELRVAVDLLDKGYEVFRALSSSCSCDLAVLKNGKLLRIEVRTAYLMPSGNIVCALNRIKADILAKVLKNKIIYKPEI